MAGGGAGDQHEIAAGRDELLLVAENFAEAAFRAIAEHGVADGSGRGHDADAGNRPRGRGGGRGVGVATAPPHREGAAVDAAALFADGANIALAAQVLLRAETHGGVARLASACARRAVADGCGGRGNEPRLRRQSGVCGL